MARGPQARAISPQRRTALDLRRLKCVDESGVHLAMTRGDGRAPTGARVMGSEPQNYGQHDTMLGALGVQGRHVVMTVDAAPDTAVFRTSVKRGLGPTRRPGEMVVMDNLRAHKAVGVQQALARGGAHRLYLPPYAPDLSLIEPCWSKVKTAVRTAQERTREALDMAITGALATITDTDAHGWFRHCGYALR